MSRKESNLGLTPPAENRRKSIAKGLLSPTDGSRRPSNLTDGARRPSNLMDGARRPSTFMTAGGLRTSLPGPSLIGLLASKRLARRLTTRLFGRKGSSRFSGVTIPVKKEPTYRMEPHRKFQSERVQDAIQNVLDNRLEKFTYRSKLCANLSKVLSDEIKDKVKLMNFDRYRIICEVHIGQNMQQGMMVTSRCTWDPRVDDFATYTFKNGHIFCTATVFGVYLE
ncbi:dynein light chain Tctex-type 5-B-like [Gigantopelta aegis]|uniref:dynein light chain Tctex-type 5-B-like n=1 Tax=Gigantopelta aegis TaxID=1735272 RepID=UPI001B88DC73|nr:dynein light chain Tctex-type 5-B-like [Gigantopelta aegis]